jgi:1,2-phenylacetyl-CoA epoxidase PaaB subunit
MRYEVFAQINPGGDITHIGRVEAENGRLAKSYARTTFDEEDWNYMAVVAENDLLEVTGEHEIPTPEVDA